MNEELTFVIINLFTVNKEFPLFSHGTTAVRGYS